ncbi:unnamed protein product, partial [Owenia fusiformis]
MATLDQVRELLTDSFDKLKREIKEDVTENSNKLAKKLKKDEKSLEFKNKGNKIQYEFNAGVIDTFDEISGKLDQLLETPDIDKQQVIMDDLKSSTKEGATTGKSSQAFITGNTVRPTIRHGSTTDMQGSSEKEHNVSQERPIFAFPVARQDIGETSAQVKVNSAAAIASTSKGVVDKLIEHGTRNIGAVSDSSLKALSHGVIT